MNIEIVQIVWVIKLQSAFMRHRGTIMIILVDIFPSFQNVGATRKIINVESGLPYTKGDIDTLFYCMNSLYSIDFVYLKTFIFLFKLTLDHLYPVMLKIFWKLILGLLHLFYMLLMFSHCDEIPSNWWFCMSKFYWIGKSDNKG